MTLLKAVRKKLISSSGVRQVIQLVEIARPLAQDMKLLKPSLARAFNQYVPFTVFFTMKVTVFIVSTVLHLVFMYVYYRFNLKDRIFPKKKAKKNEIKPVLHVPHACSPDVSEKNVETLSSAPPKWKNRWDLNSSPKKRLSLNFINKQRLLHLLLLNLPTLMTTVFSRKEQTPSRKGTIQLPSNEKKPPLDWLDVSCQSLIEIIKIKTCIVIKIFAVTCEI